MNGNYLQALGLLESESKVYLALIKLGTAQTGKIAKETKLNRVSVYKALDNLIQKGLATYIIKANRKYFKAANPAVLKTLIESKKHKLRIIENKIPILESVYSATSVKSKIESSMYEGIKGAKTVWETWLKELKKGDEWLIIGVPKSAEILGGYFKEFNKRRAKQGITMKIIYNKNAKKLLEARKKQPLTEVKIMPNEYITPASIEVIKDKVSIVLYEPEIILFVINSKEVADSFKQYFNLLWRIARSVRNL